MERQIKRVLLLAGVCLLALGCGKCGGDAKPATGGGPSDEAPTAGPATTAAAGRLVILGFDGVDPDWVDRYAAQGKLPTLAKLVKAHGGKAYHRLRSTNPPQSPVAWTTFATGTDPGDHGIFDFIGRKLAPGALPVLPTVATTSFEVREDGPPVARNLRTGQPFWQLLGNDGVGVAALNVPYSFPPDPMRDGRMLSGLGVPDLRETNSTFTYIGTDVTEAQVKRPPGGGVMVRLELQDNRGQVELEGPSVPGGKGARMKLPITIIKDEPAGSMSVEIAGTKTALKIGEWSDWVELEFAAEGSTVRGIARMLALEAGDNTRLFVTPMSMHPKAPYSPFTYPNKLAAQLADELGGFYKTVGWDHDTSALNAEVIDEGQFRADMDAIETQRRAMLMERLSKDDWELLIWVSTSTDRVAHMFYRLIDEGHPSYDAELAAEHGDAIEHEYRRMDETIALALQKLKPSDTLLIISDHGFHGYRRGLHVNQWLLQQGLLALKDDAKGSTRDFFLDVDWDRTRAYAMGTGQIYVNRKGREPRGVVEETEVPAVIKQIREGLVALRDVDRDQAKVVDEVYDGGEVFAGGRAADAPDLQIAFAEHYRTSWETILGGVPDALFADNPKKWSGDHAASDVRETAGFLVSNRPIDKADPGIVDLAPTAVSFFGRGLPDHYDGAPLLSGPGQGQP